MNPITRQLGTQRRRRTTGGLPPLLAAASVVGLAATACDEPATAKGSPRPDEAAAEADASSPASATLTVNAANKIGSFVPANVFGVNVLPYVNGNDYEHVQAKVQAAGNGFLRYPGGFADEYHWNGSGQFGTDGTWSPDRDTYSAGFQGSLTHRGTTSSYVARSAVTDGNPETYWLSNTDTDAPGAQWVYVDLDTAQPVDSVDIDWGSPYATLFRVQYWDASDQDPWPPYRRATDGWIDTSGGEVAGSGGSQSLVFDQVTTRYLRVVMLQSSTPVARYSVRELRVYDGSALLTRNVDAVNGTKPDQTKAVASSNDLAVTRIWDAPFDFESFMAYVGSFSPRLSPVITVNSGSATPAEAAAWVHYANVVKGYGIRYWEIGNELNGDWEQGGPLGAQDYARRYIRFYEAMKQEDPTIVIGGPAAGQVDVPSNDFDGKSFVQGFIDRLAADPGGSRADYAEFIAIHSYPYWENTDPALNLQSPMKWQAWAETDLPRSLANHPRASTVPIFLSEMNSGAATPLTVGLTNGLWLASMLGEFTRYFGSRGYASFFTVLHPSQASTDATAGDHAYLELASGPYNYQERATYWAMQMLANDWAIAGDTASHSLVETASDQAALRAYADYRPDGKLSLLVVNTDPVDDHTTEVKLGGFTPAPTATVWTFDASNYAWNTAARPYHADPDTPPSSRTLSRVGSSFAYTFRAYSITVILLGTP
jgi:hypothetical protein